MTTQDETFKAYYAAMADADLLKLAANKRSYIEVAQKMMADELDRRHLSLPADADAVAGTKHRWSFAKLGKVFHH